MLGRPMLNIPVLCHKCNQFGYLCCGRVDSIYRPKRGEYCGLFGYDPGTNKVIYDKRYGFFYIRHYSPEMYRKQMERYRSHQLKSRPNGQKRCYVKTSISFHWNEQNKFGAPCMDSRFYNGKRLPRARAKLPKIFRTSPIDFSPSGLFITRAIC
jgi:hypothetical protein